MRSIAINKRLDRLEKRLMPVDRDTEISRQKTQEEMRRQRVERYFEAHGLPSPFDEKDPLPPIPEGALRGMAPIQVQILLLERGRERNYLRRLDTQKRSA